LEGNESFAGPDSDNEDECAKNNGFDLGIKV
jgi:hypothetical protein